MNSNRPLRGAESCGHSTRLRWVLPASCPHPPAGPGLTIGFPSSQERSEAPESSFIGMSKKEREKRQEQKNFMETFLWGFVKSFPTPWSPKLRPDSLTVLPLTYCSDMQIPSLPLKTESTSHSKPILVLLSMWLDGAQQHGTASWLTPRPDAVPGSSRPLPPQRPGYSSRKTLHLWWQGVGLGQETPRGSQKHRERRPEREKKRQRERPERETQRRRNQGEKESNQRESPRDETETQEKERPRDGGQNREGSGAGGQAGLQTGFQAPPATSLSLSLTPPPLASCPTTPEASLAAPPASLTPHTAGSLTEHMQGWPRRAAWQVSSPRW